MAVSMPIRNNLVDLVHSIISKIVHLLSKHVLDEKDCIEMTEFSRDIVFDRLKSVAKTETRRLALASLQLICGANYDIYANSVRSWNVISDALNVLQAWMVELDVSDFEMNVIDLLIITCSMATRVSWKEDDMTADCIDNADFIDGDSDLAVSNNESTNSTETKKIETTVEPQKRPFSHIDTILNLVQKHKLDLRGRRVVIFSKGWIGYKATIKYVNISHSARLLIDRTQSDMHFGVSVIIGLIPEDAIEETKLQITNRNQMADPVVHELSTFNDMDIGKHVVLTSSVYIGRCGTFRGFANGMAILNTSEFEDDGEDIRVSVQHDVIILE